jgi:hypothetical protein
LVHSQAKAATTTIQIVFLKSAHADLSGDATFQSDSLLSDISLDRPLPRSFRGGGKLR